MSELVFEKEWVNEVCESTDHLGVNRSRELTIETIRKHAREGLHGSFGQYGIRGFVVDQHVSKDSAIAQAAELRKKWPQYRAQAIEYANEQGKGWSVILWMNYEHLDIDEILDYFDGKVKLWISRGGFGSALNYYGTLFKPEETEFWEFLFRDVLFKYKKTQRELESKDKKIKELEEENRELREKIEELRKRISELENKIIELENRESERTYSVRYSGVWFPIENDRQLRAVLHKLF